MMKNGFFILIPLAFFTLISVSCKKKPPVSVVESPASPAKSHTWYYFSDGAYNQIKSIASVQKQIFKPWTESVRVSDAGCRSDEALLLDSSAKGSEGFFIVNRLGLLEFSDSEIRLCSDPQIFTETTADGLVFADGQPFFSVYRNSFFNESARLQNSFHPFLIQFSPEQHVFFPTINVENLGLSAESEITDFVWDGQFWTCAVKTAGQEKISFSYLTFQAKEPLGTISPQNAAGSLFVRSSNQDEFRESRKILSLKKLPPRVAELLATVAERNSVFVKVHTAGGHSARSFTNAKENDDQVLLTSYAVLQPEWAGCLFEDGTFYFKGALFGKSILNRGRPLGIKLPKLPNGFCYSYFVISESTMYAAWEEKSFYTMARSGFVAVDLKEILYNNEKIR